MLTNKEFDRLQDAIVALESPHVRAAFALLVSTGARVSGGSQGTSGRTST